MNASKLIAPLGLLWGQPEVSAEISSEAQSQLISDEIHDWLSALYWAEGLAIRYALAMLQNCEERQRPVWRKIYHEEIDHQLRLGSWLMENDLPPRPPNMAVKFASHWVDEVVKSKKDCLSAEAVANSQWFFEEYTSRLLKWRIPYVVDRDLASLLLKINRDEAYHVKVASHQANSLGEIRTADSVLRSHSNFLFPLHLAKGVLTARAFRAIRKVAIPPITERIFFNSDPRQFDVESILPPEIRRFSHLPDYNCIGCSPVHSIGLHLRPMKATDRPEVTDEIAFPARFQGFNGIVHGGAISMVLDEMAGAAVIVLMGKLAVTKRLTVNFFAPVAAKESYRLVSRIGKSDRQNVTCYAEILDSNGTKMASAEADMFLPNKKTARKLFPQIADHPILENMFQESVDANREG